LFNHHIIHVIASSPVFIWTKHYQYVSLIWKLWRTYFRNWNFRDQNHPFIKLWDQKSKFYQTLSCGQMYIT